MASYRGTWHAMHIVVRSASGMDCKDGNHHALLWSGYVSGARCTTTEGLQDIQQRESLEGHHLCLRQPKIKQLIIDLSGGLLCSTQRFRCTDRHAAELRWKAQCLVLSCLMCCALNSCLHRLGVLNARVHLSACSACSPIGASAYDVSNRQQNQDT